MVVDYCALVNFSFRGQERAVFMDPRSIKGLSEMDLDKLGQVKFDIIEPTEFGLQEGRLQRFLVIIRAWTVQNRK